MLILALRAASESELLPSLVLLDDLLAEEDSDDVLVVLATEKNLDKNLIYDQHNVDNIMPSTSYNMLFKKLFLVPLLLLQFLDNNCFMHSFSFLIKAKINGVSYLVIEHWNEFLLALLLPLISHYNLNVLWLSTNDLIISWHLIWHEELCNDSHWNPRHAALPQFGFSFHMCFSARNTDWSISE